MCFLVGVYWCLVGEYGIVFFDIGLVIELSFVDVIYFEVLF